MRQSIAALAGVWFVVAAAVELAPASESLRRVLRDGFGPEGGPSGRSTRLVQQLGAKAGSNGWVLRAADAPSSKTVAKSFLKPGQWLVSVAVPQESLHDPERGIRANSEKRGREWERLAWVSVYNGPRLAFATRAGLRSHGGPGRESFRVIFRSSYGLPHMPADGPFPPMQRPADRFLIRRSQTLVQAQPIAFDIARQVGALAPAAVSARFVLNGSLRPVPYELTEHVSREGWGRSFFGHDDFVFRQFRAIFSEPDNRPYEALRTWITSAPRPLLAAHVGERVDLDNLARHVFTIMYCGTLDWDQGAAVHDLRVPGARWFWVHWDLDQSLTNGMPTPWTRSSVQTVLGAPANSAEARDVRTLIIGRLLREDPQFARDFMTLAAELLNHRLTQPFLQGLVLRYSPLAVNSRPFNGHDLAAFFAHRGDTMFDAVAAALRQARPRTVRVSAPGGFRLEVDGYTYGSEYAGRYFDGQTIAVRAVTAEGQPAGAWIVNGRVSDSNVGSFVVDRDLAIQMDR